MAVYKICRFFSHFQLEKRLIVRQRYKYLDYCRNLHDSQILRVKMFMEHENKFAYSIMENQGYVIKLNFEENSTLLPKQPLQDLLSQDWLKKTHSDVISIFPVLGVLCSEKKLCISNTMFDDFIDNLTDKLAVATDAELESVFYSLLKWPETESIRTRNYIEVWAALDDECLKRLRQWSYDEMLHYATLFFMLNVTRVSDYSNKCLLKLASRAKNLTPAQLVKTMFFIGIRRNSPKEIHNLEVCINNHFNEFTIDELAVISMGFFKSKTPIRNMDLVKNIINKIIENRNKIHEISLAALLKVIRYSMKISTDDCIYLLLDKLQHEVPRLSVMCNVHVGLLGTSTLTLHEDCLDAIANRVGVSMSEARMKDLERLTLIFGTFNYKPQFRDFFDNLVKELKRPEREHEINTYGRSLACCVAYLSLLGIYPEDLIEVVLSRGFLQKVYGKHCMMYGREILTLHNVVKIFYKDHNISQLTEKEVVIMAKKYTDYVPNPDYSKQYNVTDKMFLEVLSILKESRGSDFVTAGHIVTHHQRGDIILCNNRDGLGLPVGNTFHTKHFGLLKTVPDNNIWIVLIIAGRNVLIRNTQVPTGIFTSKLKELRTLGYCAELVLWDKFTSCETKEAKLSYLNHLIQEAVKSKYNITINDSY